MKLKLFNQKIKILIPLLFLLVSAVAMAQSKTITGTVLSAEDNMPLPGASVIVKGTTNGASTDFDGKFSLSVNSNQTTLTVSYLGYKTKDVAITSNTITVSLTADASTLDEIVVVGYGSVKKSDVVGAVTSVDIEEATAIPTTNVSEMLRGRAAGVQVNLSDARPGGDSNIVIRGKTSLDAGNDPLIIVDGIPYDSINDVAPEDITSIEILKDASSQAIYGSRASNGVILITTKRGKEGKINVNYHGYTTIQTLTRNFDVYDGEEFAQLRREANRTANGGVYLTDPEIFESLELETIQNGNYTDWEDVMLRDALLTSHSLNVSGGSEQTKVFSSLTYFKQDGLIPSSGFDRGTFRTNIDQKITDKLSMQANVNFQTSNQDRESNSIDFINISPLAQAYDANGDLLKLPFGPTTTRFNPLWNIRESVDEIKTRLTDINLVANYQITPSLSYKLNTFLRNRNADRGVYRTSLHSSGDGDVNGLATLRSENYKEQLIENIVDYKPKINQNHVLDFTFVHAINERSTEATQIVKSGFANDALGYNGDATAVVGEPVRDVEERKLVSFLGRVRYNLFDKYLFTFTARADGSTVFAENNKWGYFPAAAFAWKMHEESFLKNSQVVNQMKFRVSYGDTGNEGIEPFQSLGVAGALPYVFGGTTVGGFSGIDRLPNPNLKWETTTSLNLGLDFGLIKNRLTGTVEYYKANTTDLLFDRDLSGTSGYTVTRFNIGEVENKGVEVSLNAKIIRNQDLNWSVGVNWSTNSNKILSLDGSVDENGVPLDFVNDKLFIGESIDIIRTEIFDGIWQEGDDIANSAQPTAQPGFIKVVNITDTDPDVLNIGQEDLVIIDENPDWYGSVNTTLEYKGFELYADLYIDHGSTRFNPYQGESNSGAGLQGISNGIKVDYYTPENPSNKYPRPNVAADPFLDVLGVADASYVRLRTLSLGYNFPSDLLTKLGIRSLNVYATGTNLFTLTDYKSYSPEINPGSFPDTKGLTVGVKVGI
ncbi:TonB-linked SusC/RagA family outer membrane protein [Mariniflexile fucanivorans]|uniref:TonB-linked SusC/RagA family outer membrane protein n=1 Tax=Mariniflexile fucanivorans TaxID=264023 RepID=A0A4R1RKT1_9FLAO|nr:TonB-dependent receptor [Mariniflexile fucanivorans]TCL66808.1 TonB-linked SusC/RagA family outer membrane protein [Mariniflexile fucanivorans]